MEKQDLINSIIGGLTAAEMAVKFHIHDLDLYREINNLENDGYTLSRKYYSDGKFKYTFAGNDHLNDEVTNIITKPTEQEVRVVCISDMHYTSKFQNLDMVHRAYDYAIRNGINLVFVGGDFLHGKFGYNESTFEDGMKQIETFIKDYPFNNNVLTFGVGGDHDESIYHEDYINPIKVISSRRHDIVIPNYIYSPLMIKDARIQLKHKKNQTGQNPNHRLNVTIPTVYEIALNGHLHRYDYIDSGDKITINLPTTSNITPTLNGFVVLTLKYNNDHLADVESDYISVINGQEVTLVHNGGVVNFKRGTINNISEFNHKSIINPYQPTEYKNNAETITKLTEKVTITNDKLETALTDNKKLTEKNNELSSSLSDANAETERLKNVIKGFKNDKTVKNDKIEELEKENRRVFDSNRQLTTNNKLLKDDNKNLKEDNQNLKNSNQELLNELNEYKRLVEELMNKQKTEEVSKEVVPEKIEKVLNDIEEHKEAVRRNGERLSEIIKNNDEKALGYQENLVDSKEEIHELFESVASLDKKKDEEASVVAENPVVDETPIVEEANEELNNEFYYNEFKKERINEFKKYLKKQAKKEEKNKPTVLAVGHGNSFLHEALKTIEDAPVIVEQFLPNEEFREKMCDVMESAAFSMSGETEKKKMLKRNKSIQKNERILSSQMSNKERIEEFRKKMAHKKK